MTTSGDDVDFYEKWSADEAHCYEIVRTVKRGLRETFDEGGTLQDAYYGVLNIIATSPARNIQAYHAVLITSLALAELTKEDLDDDLDKANEA